DTLAHLVGDPGTAAQAGVVVEFVTALTQMRDAQDDHLRFEPAEAAERHEHAGIVQPPAEQPSGAAEGAEQVGVRGTAGSGQGLPCHPVDRAELLETSGRDAGCHERQCARTNPSGHVTRPEGQSRTARAIRAKARASSARRTTTEREVSMWASSRSWA